MPKLTINGIEIEVPAGTSILQAAEQLGIEIPRFCFHDRLSVPANCRMCLVEVAPGPPKPQASCALACADGMVVKTDTPMIKKARKGVMEFLLINHPLDCPICDQGGECDLQDQAMAYGFDRSRYAESKRAVPEKDFGPLIKTSMTRCIQCTRCVRFGEEIAGVPTLGLLNRGEDVEIGTFVGKAIKSELSGNMIDICPVGALTSKPYAFKARPWELRKTETIDIHDAVGSNIRIDARGGEVMRALPRLHEDVNEEWISDKTRFAVDGLSKRRLDRPYVRGADGKLRAASWDEALAVVAEKLRKTRADRVAALAGDLADIESMVALKDLMDGLKITNLECRADGTVYDTSVRAGYLFNTGIAALEEADAVLLIGTNPRIEAPMINARIRKAWVNRRVKVGVIGTSADLSYPATHIGTGTQDIEKLITGKHDFSKVLQGAQKPVIILGMGALRHAQGEAVQALVRLAAEKLGVIKEGWNGFNMLHTAASRVGALDIGFSTRNGFDIESVETVYLLGADDFDLDIIPKNAFVIYQGHHGDAGAHRADVILPGAAYTEKNGTYVNTEGRVQRARKAVAPPGEAREDWKIIRALSAVAGRTLPYDDAAHLAKRIVKEWPHLGEADVVKKAEWKKFAKEEKVSVESFGSYYDGFHLTNAISRASPTMQKCVESFSGGGCGSGGCGCGSKAAAE